MGLSSVKCRRARLRRPAQYSTSRMNLGETERTGRIRKWDGEEKQRLLDLTRRYTHNNRVMWHEVIQFMPHRTINQCKTKFMLELNDRQNQVTNKWTQAEYALLVQQVAQHGRKWSEIQQRHFPGRDSDSLRIKYMTNVRRTQQGAADPKSLTPGHQVQSVDELAHSQEKPDSQTDEAKQPGADEGAALIRELLALLQ